MIFYIRSSEITIVLNLRKLLKNILNERIGYELFRNLFQFIIKIYNIFIGLRKKQLLNILYDKIDPRQLRQF